LQAVGSDGAEPAAKRPGPLALEARQLPDQDGQDFLNEVLGLLAQGGIAQQPAVDQRSIEIVEPLPVGGRGPQAQTFKQADRRVHGLLT
jgi:hypothetical protein